VPGSHVALMVIPTDEEATISRQTRDLVARKMPKTSWILCPL